MMERIGRQIWQQKIRRFRCQLLEYQPEMEVTSWVQAILLATLIKLQNPALRNGIYFSLFGNIKTNC